MVKVQCQSSDRISALPQVTIEKILTHMPIRDALRTSILSKKWRYSWTSMPNLVFDDKLVYNISPYSKETNRYKLVSVIFHVLLLHKGPILEFSLSISRDTTLSDEIHQIILHLSRDNKIKKFILKTISSNSFYDEYWLLRYKLPSLFFTLGGLEQLDLTFCEIELPLTFSGFNKLKSLKLRHVNITTETLQQLLTYCPLLEKVILMGSPNRNFSKQGNTCTFLELSNCLPLVQILKISKSYIQDLVAGSMPPSLVHLRKLFLDVCFFKHDEVLLALKIISSSPNLEKIHVELCRDHKLCNGETLNNLVDLDKDYSGLNLEHLKELEITRFNCYDPEMAFVKLIMGKSPMLQKARIELSSDVSDYKELKMLRALIRFPPFLRASLVASVIVERTKY